MNQFEVIKVIGEGAYGIVWKCRNKETNDIVAVKKFKYCETTEDRKLANREVRLLRMLAHPNIVHLMQGFRRKGILYLVFEYMDQTLLSILEYKPKGIGSRQVRNIMTQLAASIRWCHSNKVIHRDIKPENILVDRDIVKLCDFGFARHIKGNIEERTLTEYVSTRWYRAPELLVLPAKYGYGVDCWALGCIFIEMLLGTPLLSGENDIEQLALIEMIIGSLPKPHNDFLRNSGIMCLPTPKPLKSYILDEFGVHLCKKELFLLQGLLEPDKNDRLKSSEFLKHPYFEMKRCLTGDPSNARIRNIDSIQEYKNKCKDQRKSTRVKLRESYGENEVSPGETKVPLTSRDRNEVCRASDNSLVERHISFLGSLSIEAERQDLGNGDAAQSISVSTDLVTPSVDQQMLVHKGKLAKPKKLPSFASTTKTKKYSKFENSQCKLPNLVI